MRKIWITWECQRRNRELSEAVGAQFFELLHIAKISNPLIKYICGIRDTLKILRAEKPFIVFCQNPSIVLCLFVIIYKKIFKIYVCVDSHNAGIYPKEGCSKILNFISRYIQRQADLTLVTNEGLSDVVKKNGGRPFVLQDKIPKIPDCGRIKLQGSVNILFICTFAVDEPYDLVFNVSTMLDKNIYIYITGNYSKKIKNIKNLPKNVILTGFVSEEMYCQLLRSVDLTIDLTNREDCLVCGAYESVAVEVPMILSKTAALEEYFKSGAVYTEHASDSLYESLMYAVHNKEILKKQIRALRLELDKQWQFKLDQLVDILEEFD